MVFYKNNPFVRLLLPLIVGIILQYYLKFSDQNILLFFAVIFLLLIIVFIIKLSYTLHYVKGSVISIFLIICGALLLQQSSSEFQAIRSDNKILLLAQIDNVPLEREKNFKTEITIYAQKEGNNWKEVNAKAIAYFEKDSNIINVKAGNNIALSTHVNAIQNRKNPFGFNYAKYLELKQINQSVYIKNGDWQLLSNDEHGLKERALNLRQAIINKYEFYGITGDNLAILSALTLGYKNKLDAKVRDAYSGAGAMHVLAVSGLHVGIIYLVLNFIFSWIAIFSKLKKVKFIFIFVALWGYAFLTGLSPSVLRATIMFSFIIVGKIIDKKVNIYNSLAASAFLLLIINPFLLFEVGFQLSYIAVVGIVFFHPKIVGLIYVKNKLLKGLWSLTAVSIAAQLVTFPITIYHFHQFPTYFWISNIGVTFFAFILIFLSILFSLLFSWIFVAKIIGTILSFILKINLIFIQWVNELPGAVISDISFTTTQVLLLYIFIFGIGIWLVTKKYAAFIAVLLSVLIFGFVNIRYNIYRNNQSAVCVYQVPSETAIQFIHHKKSTWLTSKSENNSRIEKTISEGNIFWKTKNNSYSMVQELNDSIIKNDNFYMNSGFWAFENSKGLIIHTNSQLPRTPKDTLCLDFIFVSGNPSFTLNDISDKIKFKQIIIDGSVPYWKAKQFSSKTNGVNLFVTKDKGAFMFSNKL